MPKSEEEHNRNIEHIIKLYFASIYLFIFRLVGDVTSAEDLTQDTFVKVWRHLPEYEREEELKNWIFTIARNTALDWLRKKRSLVFSQINNPKEFEGAFDEMGSFDPASGDALPEEIFARQEVKGYLEKCVAQLPLVYQEVIYLRLEGDLTLEQIAEILGKSVNTVKSIYRRGLEKLRVSLKREFFE